MELVMDNNKRMMRKIEKRYPNLINCFGNLNTANPDCQKCNFVYPCWQIQGELKKRCFAEGRYRYGFGRLAIDKKHNIDWIWLRENE